MLTALAVVSILCCTVIYICMKKQNACYTKVTNLEKNVSKKCFQLESMGRSGNPQTVGYLAGFCWVATLPPMQCIFMVNQFMSLPSTRYLDVSAVLCFPRTFPQMGFFQRLLEQPGVLMQRLNLLI